MKSSIFSVALVTLTTSAATTAHAATLTIEPDNYPDQTVLDHLIPGLTLSVTDAAETPSNFFTVTAITSPAGFQSTGTKVFAESNVDFWDPDFRLRMDFTNPVSGVSIDAIGGTNFNTDLGILETYNAAGQLLHTYTTQPLAPNRIETMSIQDASPDIAFAVAYGIKGSANSGPFLALDHLTLTNFTAPEPTTLTLLSSTALPLLTRRRRQPN